MEQQSVHKMYKYKLKPTPEQERILGRVLMLCGHVYNAAIGERREAWRMCGVSVSYYQQKAELPGIKEVMPEYAEVHSQVLQNVVLRVERAFQGSFVALTMVKRPVIRASMDVIATPPSPILNVATAWWWMVGFSICRRSVVSLYACAARWKVRPRPS
jgi:hypothetical protein